MRARLITAATEGRCVTQMEVSEMDQFLLFLTSPRAFVLPSDFRLPRGYASFRPQCSVNQARLLYILTDKSRIMLNIV